MEPKGKGRNPRKRPNLVRGKGDTQRAYAGRYGYALPVKERGRVTELFVGKQKGTGWGESGGGFGSTKDSNSSCSSSSNNNNNRYHAFVSFTAKPLPKAKNEFLQRGEAARPLFVAVVVEMGEDGRPTESGCWSWRWEI